jgi:hypothetical protein
MSVLTIKTQHKIDPREQHLMDAAKLHKKIPVAINVGQTQFFYEGTVRLVGRVNEGPREFNHWEIHYPSDGKS